MEARFSAPVQTSPGAHPISCTMCTGPFLGVKRPGRGFDHPPHLVPRFKKVYIYTSTHPQFFMFCYWVNFTFTFTHCIIYSCGLGSSVGTATYYGLDGPGWNPGGDEIFRSSRPALGPTQSPVEWVPGLSRG